MFHSWLSPTQDSTSPTGRFRSLGGYLGLAVMLAGAQSSVAQNLPAEMAEAPEWTTVTATLSGLPEDAEPGGVVFFLPQRRLIEIPAGKGALDAVAERSEGSAPVSPKGRVELRLPPGNYILTWDPNASSNERGVITSPAASDPAKSLGTLGKPGPLSLQLAEQGSTGRDQVAARRLAAIREVSESGRPTVLRGNELNLEGNTADILPVFVVFNRFVRPPLVDLGTWTADAPDKGTVIIRLTEKDGSPMLQGTMRIRGHNGDMLEPLPQGRVQLPEKLGFVTGPGVFVFRDVLAQPYQAVLQSAPPAPPAGAVPGTRASEVLQGTKIPKPTDRPTDRTIADPDFVYDGENSDLTMTFEPLNTATD